MNEIVIMLVLVALLVLKIWQLALWHQGKRKPGKPDRSRRRLARKMKRQYGWTD